jgi:peptidoglycan-associated lipoprotein
MGHMTKAGQGSWFALLYVAAVMVITGCATTASYRSEIESMKAALAEAKAAGAESFAPEEYAKAEMCLDWITHEATEYRPFTDHRISQYLRECRAAFQALQNKVAAAREGRIPVEPVGPPTAPRPDAPPAAAPGEAVKESPLQDVFFDFDRSLIRADARKALDENVRWLKANPSATIVIEGHCDERGTREYNLALGQRRARAARDYVVAAGIDAKRVKTISYGKERPFVLGHDESAWRWNRRAHFVLQ